MSPRVLRSVLDSGPRSLQRSSGEKIMTMTTQAVSVSRTVTVKAGLEHAFKVFTEGFDTWWPRSHHIGKKPLQKAVIEPRAGGRCYGREADGNGVSGDGARLEPPNRLVIACTSAPLPDDRPESAASVKSRSRSPRKRDNARRPRPSSSRAPRRRLRKLRMAVGSPGGGAASRMFNRTANVYQPSSRGVHLREQRQPAGVSRQRQAGSRKRPTPQTNSMLWITRIWWRRARASRRLRGA